MIDKKEYLKEMGIDVWQEKNQTAIDEEVKNICNLNLADVKKEIASCRLCALHKTRTNIVFGVGNECAKAMFIGEAPGANEDLQGEPFVGRAGMLLNAMLKSIGLNRSDIYIANILKCRPPSNRDPLPEEIRICTPYLEQQISFLTSSKFRAL